MKRDIRIDALRSLGIILIMLAHVQPPDLIFHLRTFDVPLMSILLGMSFVLSSRKRKGNLDYKKYIKKRFSRLVIPVWVFITVYLMMYFIGSILLDIPFPFSTETIFSSYFIIPGISYIWIIRVFFTIAILSPFLLRISQSVTTLTKKITILGLSLVIQFILCLITYSLNGSVQLLFEELIAISFGYSILAVIGMWAVEHNRKENFILSGVSLVGFIILGIVNGFIPLNNFKYPPTPYFLLYGIGISLMILVVLSSEKIKFLLNNKFVEWSSKHSLQLYYWHVFPVSFLNAVIPEAHFLFQFLFVLFSAYILTFLQMKFVPGFFSLEFTLTEVKQI